MDGFFSFISDLLQERKMKRICVIIGIVFLSMASVNAQKLSILSSVNTGGIGLHYESIEYSGGYQLASPGGGTSMELGIRSEILKKLYVYATFGNQLSLGYTNTTSGYYSSFACVKFRKQYMNIGAQYLIGDHKRFYQGFVLGLGGAFNRNACLETESDYYANDLREYDPSLGLLAEGKFRFKVSPVFHFEAGATFRYLIFKEKITETKLNASGFQLLSLTCVFNILD